MISRGFFRILHKTRPKTSLNLCEVIAMFTMLMLDHQNVLVEKVNNQTTKFKIA